MTASRSPPMTSSGLSEDGRDRSEFAQFYYGHVKNAEVTGEHEVTFTFDSAGNRELPHIMGQLQVLPKHWWEGKDAQGRQRDISKTTLEPPLGSGPYRIKSFEAGTATSSTSACRTTGPRI